VLGLADEHRQGFSMTTWGNVHTLAVVLATGFSVGFGVPALLAWVAAASFLILVIKTRGSWTPDGHLGVANLVTTLRLSMTLALLVGHSRFADAPVALTALAILVLDGVDGYLARRYDAASDFGARYDVEADSLFVIALSVILLARGATGPWVLVAGLWRYFSILAGLVVPRPAEAPRTLFGRVSYVLMLVSFILALLLPAPYGGSLALVGTCGVSISFIRSFWLCYFPKRDAA
jgi:phosphatidylglycerophosphate synthase